MTASPPPVGLLDLLAAFLAAVFVVSGLLVLSPWTLRLACLAGSLVGIAAGWRMTQHRTWDAKLLAQPLGGLVGFALGGALWWAAGTAPWV